ncbi:MULTISPECIES: TolC family protein [Hydrocarboniphaga]|jgi:outer membrane protein TolC|uniref:Outer membrane efflux protein n=1 Tax=Hydrocarboniphaga effusa AP103 TaxID=1172194 RepID=I7ZCR6_9GAMM|nr:MULTISPECIES: TolC family protein [Hydrocarboniphaga]EIT69679.1 hypothetical protein WQQ_32610 [Hydrocarboniphaga effusa AP103]MDZ4080014.1 TolC family protein [Hydrocarboniphaga sp.]
MAEHSSWRPRLAGLSLLAASLLGAPAAVLAQQDTAALSLAELIERALQNSPVQGLADRGLALAQAQRDISRGALLPQLDLQAMQARQTSNPAAMGFEFPGLPELIGPFSVFDARVRLSQKLLDLSTMSEVSSRNFAVDAARAQVEVQREQLAAQVAVSFIRVLAGEQALESAKADLALAEDLLVQARDQRQAGVAAGVDVSRSETAVAQDRYAVSEAQTAIAQSRLQLQRLASLPMGQAIVLSGDLKADGSLAPGADDALAVARSDRADLALVQAQLKQAEAALQAARRRVLPTVSAFADYGLSANTPNKNEQDTYRYGAQIQMPLYAGGAVSAGKAAAELQVEQQRLRLDDLREQIEQDVRLAVVTVANTREQMAAAEAALAFAERELELARDRFLNGIANNVDVVTAQANLARARTQVVSAQAAYQQARVNLASAQGHARQFRL